MSDKELSIIIRAKDAASAVFNKISGTVNGLALNSQKLEMTFKNFNKVGSNLVNSGTKMFLAGGGLIAGLGLAVKKASDLNEVQDKFQAVMGDSAQAAESYAKDLIKSYGMSEKGAKEYLASFGDIFAQMGANSNETSKLSMEFVKLSSDLANFKNVKIDEVMRALRDATLGTTRGLRTLGISIEDTDIKQEALNKGITKSGQEMTKASMAAALLSLIISKTPAAIGQTQREFNGLDGQLERMQNRFDDLVTNIGKGLIPMLEQLFQKIEPTINNVIEFTQENQDLLSSVAKGALILGGMLSVLGLLNIGFGTVLKSISGVAWAVTSVVSILGKVGPALTAGMLASNAFSIAVGATLGAAVIATTVGIGKLMITVLEYNKALNDLADSTEMLSDMEHKGNQRALQAAKDTGLKIRNFKELAALQKAGLIMWDKEAGVFVKLNKEVEDHNKHLSDSKKEITLVKDSLRSFQSAAESAYKSALKNAQDYANKVTEGKFKIQKINSDISDSLRELDRKDMTDKQLQADKQIEINERKQKAIELINQITLEKNKVAQDEMIRQAEEELQKALSLTNSLNGDDLFFSKKLGKENVKQLIESIGAVQIELQSKINDMNEKAVNTYELESQRYKSLLEEISKNPIEFKIDDSAYKEILKKIETITGNKILNIKINSSSGGNSEGSIYASTGIQLPGYGGGDRISAVLEAGEAVTNKESVRAAKSMYGDGFFTWLNNLGKRAGNAFGEFQMPEVSVPRIGFANGGEVPNMSIKHMGSLNLDLNGASYPVMGNIDVIETLYNALKKQKLKRPQ